jgi:outer membrane protein OmpA-like peptidoglycan-associated protein
MKQIITAFCLVMVIFLARQEAFAQPANALTVREVIYNYSAPAPAWADWTKVWSESHGHGLQLAWSHKIQTNTFLVVPATIGFGPYTISGSSTNATRDRFFGNLDVLIQNNLFKYGSVFNPTVSLGAGSTYNFDDKLFDFNIPAALGLNVKLQENLYLNLQSQYRFSLENRNGWHHSAGIVIFIGQEKKDRDGDGVTDDVDKCPDTPGLATLMGCPDKDGDGIADMDDKCPDEAGTAALMGCPDKDGDGIADKDDDCPTEKGVAAFKGCPDTDGDGIADKDDKCPKEAGPASNQGCPIRDRDGDGIPDDQDACPTEKGPASTKGCPDKDGDGIADKDDACPNEKGTAAMKGCPDRDGDGIADKDDACPDKKGEAAHKGCPDTDGDGVYDNEDRCPDKAGPASNKGCPEIKKEDKAKVDLAVKAVQFETGKATILASSNKVLDDVASVLVKYPEYSLAISGHTDNVGDDKMNLDLSERRAKACFDYLVSKGVAATRMTHAGFGETKPVAPNTTKAGRDSNRRVEFALSIK